jgi:HSP20 family protein
MRHPGFLHPVERYPSFVGFHKSINDLFDRFSGSTPVAPLSSAEKFPTWEVAETGTAITIKAELPGLTESDIKIDAHKDSLSISGEKKEETSQDDKTYHIREVSYGKFSRSIKMPFEIDTQKTKAVFKDGVLTVSITKPVVDTQTPKSIPVSKGN